MYKCITHALYCRALAFSPLWEEVSQGNSLCIISCNIQTDCPFKGAGHSSNQKLFTEPCYVHWDSQGVPLCKVLYMCIKQSTTYSSLHVRPQWRGFSCPSSANMGTACQGYAPQICMYTSMIDRYARWTQCTWIW